MPYKNKKKQVAYVKKWFDSVKNGEHQVSSRPEENMVQVCIRIRPDIWRRLGDAVPPSKSRFTKGSRSEFIADAIDEKLKSIGK